MNHGVVALCDFCRFRKLLTLAEIVDSFLFLLQRSIEMMFLLGFLSSTCMYDASVPFFLSEPCVGTGRVAACPCSLG
jgi:hypothetical protein